MPTFRDQVFTLPGAIALFEARRVLRPILGMGHFVAHVVITEPDYIDTYSSMIDLLLNPKGGRRWGHDSASVCLIGEGKQADATVKAHLNAYRAIVFLYPGEDVIPSAFRTRSELFVVVSRPDVSVVRLATRFFCGATPNAAQTEEIASREFDDLLAAFRRGRTLDQSVELLMKSPKPQLECATVAVTHAGVPPHTQGLDALFGYEHVMEFGKQLVSDVEDYRSGRISWASVERGLLLYGPPGTGKTQFAKALAVSCKVELVTGSYSQWQSRGHQGDFLRAMAKTFQKARESAPCILVIDELDSFDRSEGGDHSEYIRALNNGLLELLDGLVDREGVVVVGTSNRPEDIYQPILRAGRIDNHFRVDLPDGHARLGIFQHYLASALPTALVREFTTATEGLSGADLEKLAREIRRQARRKNMKVDGNIVREYLPRVLRVSTSQLYTPAVHEAGHIVMGLCLGRKVQKARVEDRILPGEPSARLGGVWLDDVPVLERNHDYFLSEILIILAGIAAEQVIFGTHSQGAGGAEDSDLAKATNLATRFEAVHGMGHTLVSEVYQGESGLARLRGSNQIVWRRVDRLIKSQLAICKKVIAVHKDQVFALASHLVVMREISGEQAIAFLESKNMLIQDFTSLQQGRRKC